MKTLYRIRPKILMNLNTFKKVYPIKKRSGLEFLSLENWCVKRSNEKLKKFYYKFLVHKIAYRIRWKCRIMKDLTKNFGESRKKSCKK